MTQIMVMADDNGFVDIVLWQDLLALVCDQIDNNNWGADKGNTMTLERIDAIAQRLDNLPNTDLDNDPESHWSNGRSFDLLALAYKSGLNSTRSQMVNELAIVGNVFGLTFRHNGDYCWFDKKTNEDDK